MPERDFHEYHLRELPQRLAAGHGRAAARLARELAPLCCRLQQTDNAYTYRPGAASIDIVAGTEAAAVLELAEADWQRLVQDNRAMAAIIDGALKPAVECGASDSSEFVLRWQQVLAAMMYGCVE